MALEAAKLLTVEQVQRLRAKSDTVGALLVLHAWVLIFGSMTLFVWWPNPLTFVIAAMVIGARQLGLAILMHDAAHGLLFESRRLNERVGTWLCASPDITSLPSSGRPFRSSPMTSWKPLTISGRRKFSDCSVRWLMWAR